MKEYIPSCLTGGTWKIKALSHWGVDRRLGRVRVYRLNKTETSVFVICASVRFTVLKIWEQNICEADKEDCRTSSRDC